MNATPFTSGPSGSLLIRGFFISAGIVASVYSYWALDRVSERVFVLEDDWPRPWPYPDPWLSRFERWLDQRYLVARGSIKLHGEFSRVRHTLSGCIAGGVPILKGGILLDIAAYRRPRKPHRGVEAAGAE